MLVFKTLTPDSGSFILLGKNEMNTLLVRLVVYLSMKNL
jgi:hypothetical protein